MLRPRFMGVVWLLLGILACTAPNPHVRARRLTDGRWEVEGPLAGPFNTPEELAAAACELMTSQPGAANGLYGFEYCALHYFSAKDDAFFLSYLSEASTTPAQGEKRIKSCILPRALNDPAHPDAVILGGDHSHPHNRRFSAIDLRVESDWPPLRFVDPATQRIFDRDLMVFHREKSGTCLSYRYNQVTRMVSALRGGSWVPLGKVYNSRGDIEMLEGMDWLP